MSSIPDLKTLEKIGETSRGYYIYREPNEVGGHRYWTDSIDGGAVIWDTCIASIEELELAINYEKYTLKHETPPHETEPDLTPRF